MIHWRSSRNQLYHQTHDDNGDDDGDDDDDDDGNDGDDGDDNDDNDDDGNDNDDGNDEKIKRRCSGQRGFSRVCSERKLCWLPETKCNSPSFYDFPDLSSRFLLQLSIFL